MQHVRPLNKARKNFQLEWGNFGEIRHKSNFPARPFWVGQDLQKSQKFEVRKFSKNLPKQVGRAADLALKNFFTPDFWTNMASVEIQKIKS